MQRSGKSLHEAHECELQLQQEKESLSEELVSVKHQLEGAKKALEAEKVARKEGDILLEWAQAEITELQNTTGRLQLELKCALNEKELCPYQLKEERNKTHVPSALQCTTLVSNKASLHSPGGDGLVGPVNVSSRVITTVASPRYNRVEPYAYKQGKELHSGTRW